MTEQTYLEKNKGMLTNSKLQCFIKNPAEYKLKYVDEKVGSESSSAMKIGTAFDDFMTYDTEYFNNKYTIEKKLLKADLENLLKEKGIEIPKGSKVDDLNKLCEENGLFETDKIKLTESEMGDIKSMAFECMNQKLFNYGGNYEKQKEIIVEYKGEKIKGTFDRLGKEIRDYKTTGSIDQLMRDLKYDVNHKYKFQLSLYNWLIRQTTGESKDGILDIIESKYPYKYIAIRISAKELETYFNNFVLPKIEEFIEWKEGFYDLRDIDRLTTLNSKFYNLLDNREQEEFYTINLI